MKVLITGATSQVGTLLIKKLLSLGYRVKCLVRKTSNISELRNLDIEFVIGDVEDETILGEAMGDVRYVVHIAGIWTSKALLKVCSENRNVEKVIFIGSTSRFKKLESIDEREKQLAFKMVEAEDIIRSSGVNFVILRPTMVYGIDRDKNILQIINFMRRYRFYPLMGRGKALKSPVYVGDVADAAAQCLQSETVNRKEYVIAGKQPISYKSMLKSIRDVIPARVFLLPVPVFAGYVAVFLYRLFNRKTYINYAMIKRVNEDITYDISQAVKDFGYNPKSFAEGLKRQIEYLKMKDCL